MSKKILIVDDEKAIVDILNHNLKREGYETAQAYDGEDALNKTAIENPDLILLDAMLPKMDGFTVCKTIRKNSNVPIIMVTAKEDVVDKVIGLELGADDYITKPFSVREVLARVKANLRKFNGNETDQKSSEDEQQLLKFGTLTLDTCKYETKVSGKNVELTNTEFELLKFLAMQQGKVVSRDEILYKVWGYDNYCGDKRNVDVTINRLREKIEDNPKLPEYIITKRGVGYYFNAK